jgi:hypothetical protein
MNLDAPSLPAPAAPAWRNQLDLLLASTGEGIFVIDLQGLCTYINDAGARMLGYAPQAVLGRNMHGLTHHSHADGQPYPPHDCPIFNAFRQGLPCRIDTEVFWHRDHHAFAVKYSSYPPMDGAVVTFVDITDRKRVADRTRIAREIHDELGSLLVGLKMDVNWMDKRLGEQQGRPLTQAEEMRDRLRAKCQNMSRLIEVAVDNVGRIITDLRPSILDHQGLWAALEWQAHEFAQSAELLLDWRVQGTEGVTLPEPQAMAVFRIFQEMLSNVGRHARASALVMRMRERARHFGRELVISSQIGLGSLFSQCMPLLKT